MTAFNRVDKLFSALSAKERALMVLRAWKAGQEPDPQIKATLPIDQINEYNELIDLMNDVHATVGPLVIIQRLQVEQLGTFEGWICTVIAWGMTAFELGMHIFTAEPEPITRSGYEWLKKRSRGREPRPEWGLRYEVLPDKQANEVERRREARERIRELIKRVPWSPDRELFHAHAEAEADENLHSLLVRRLSEQFQHHWGEMLATEVFLLEAAQRFEGEEPTLLPIRDMLDWVRSELLVIRGNLKERHLQDVELPGPDETTLDAMRGTVEWPAGLSAGPWEINVPINKGDLLREEVPDQTALLPD